MKVNVARLAMLPEVSRASTVTRYVTPVAKGDIGVKLTRPVELSKAAVTLTPFSLRATELAKTSEPPVSAMVAWMVGLVELIVPVGAPFEMVGAVKSMIKVVELSVAVLPRLSVPVMTKLAEF